MADAESDKTEEDGAFDIYASILATGARPVIPLIAGDLGEITVRLEKFYDGRLYGSVIGSLEEEDPQ